MMSWSPSSTRVLALGLIRHLLRAEFTCAGMQAREAVALCCMHLIWLRHALWD